MTRHQLLTPGEAADQLRILRTRIVRLARAGDVPHIALPDGEIRFDAHDLDAWVESHKRPLLSSEVPPDDN